MLKIATQERQNGGSERICYVPSRESQRQGDLNTTTRYIHLNDDDVRAAMEKVQHGNKSGHIPNLTELGEVEKIPATDTAKRN
jgi:hypothetical protein